tara:strand:- start:77 stop:316 length:240 start_codon:yes stop_codon:yes gene_type:complete
MKPKKMTVDGKRSLAKAATWRVTASADTFVISYLITGKLTWASAIAGIEVLTKMFLYYLHERVWNKVAWGKMLKKSKKV